MARQKHLQRIRIMSGLSLSCDLQPNHKRSQTHKTAKAQGHDSNKTSKGHVQPEIQTIKKV